MKKWFWIIAFLLMTVPCYALGPEIFMGGSGAAASGTWILAPTSRGETTSTDASAYFYGTAITIPGATVSQIAFKCYQAGTSTTAHLKLVSTNDGSPAILAKGDCTPTSGQWCKVAVSYTGSENTTYRVLISSDGSMTSYADLDSGGGVWGAISAYTDYAGWVAASSPPDITGYAGDSFATDWAIAVCYGGTCAGNPE
jgi:hypothetical protein